MKPTTVPKKYFKVNERIFSRTVHVFINYTHREFAKWTKSEDY
jgi:hypothetical protein